MMPLYFTLPQDGSILTIKKNMINKKPNNIIKKLLKSVKKF